jgi:hypothetical protein
MRAHGAEDDAGRTDDAGGQKGKSLMHAWQIRLSPLRNKVGSQNSS